jgi:Leucine-rich repeat (LRR) protein
VEKKKCRVEMKKFVEQFYLIELLLSFNICRQIITLILIVKAFCILEAKEISCESVLELDLWVTGKTVKSCQIEEATVINTQDVTIASSDKSITGLYMSENKKIVLLPVRVDEVFPNLLAYSAERCSIKEISKENFAGLTNLKQLVLNHNQIERIISDTFEDLASLQLLFLSNFVSI